MKHLLLFTCSTAFLYPVTCYRTTFDDGNPRNYRFLPQVQGNEEQPSLSRQPRQNRFFSSDSNNQLFGFGNSRPNSGGFDWGNSQNSINDQRSPRQNDFVFEDNDFDDNNFNSPNVPSPSTTRRPQPSVVAVPGMATPRSVCEDNCPATSQFDPVCGNNNITYTNINWLKCAQRCGKNVTVRYVGACPRFP